MKVRALLLHLVVVCLISVLPACAADVTLPGEEVVSSAEYEDLSLLSPGTVTVVKPEEMDGEQKNLPDLLKRVPGLHIIEARGRGGYTVASVRGSTSSQVAVYIDGVLANLGSEAAVDLSTISVSDIQRIEVYRGYIPARFGKAALGGVINIVTKRVEKAGGSLSVGASSYGQRQASLSWSTQLFSGDFYMGLNHDRSNGDFEYWNDNNTPYTPGDDYKAGRQHNGYRNSDILLKWGDANWEARAAWEKNERDLAVAAPGADKPGVPEGADLDTEQISLSLGRRQKTGILDWGWQVNYLDQNKKYDDPDNTVGGWGEYHNEYDTRRWDFTIDGSMRLGDRHFLEFMGNYARERMDVTGDIITTLGGIDKFTQESWSLQLQDSIALDAAGSFLAVPVIRWNEQDGEGKFSWGLALSKELKNGWSLHASGGKYNRAPNMYELYGDGATVRPNPDLNWEEGMQFDFGVHKEGRMFGANNRSALTFFWKKPENLIEYVMTSPRFGIYQNIADAEIYGVELESSFIWQKWEAALSVTWMESENKTEDDYRQGLTLPNRPEWEGLLRVTRKFDKLSVFAEGHYIADNYFDDAATIKMDDLFTLGLGFKYMFHENLRLIMGVDDVFDEGPDVKRVPVGNGPTRTMWYPLQGRTFYATLMWDF